MYFKNKVHGNEGISACTTTAAAAAATAAAVAVLDPLITVLTWSNPRFDMRHVIICTLNIIIYKKHRGGSMRATRLP